METFRASCPQSETKRRGKYLLNLESRNGTGRGGKKRVRARLKPCPDTFFVFFSGFFRSLFSPWPLRRDLTLRSLPAPVGSPQLRKSLNGLLYPRRRTRLRALPQVAAIGIDSPAIQPNLAAEDTFPGVKSEQVKNMQLEKAGSVFPAQAISFSAMATDHDSPNKCGFWILVE